MEKALEILKQVKDLSGWIKCGAELPSDEILDEAIAELEEAMKPKTCEGCEWWDFNSYGIFKKCFNGKGNCVSTESSFGCNRFKQKENA